MGPGQLRAGEVFAKEFRVERVLGAGGMGAVYAATQLSTGHVRALKLMHPQLVPDAKSRLRFVDEARVGSRIRSEHVVEVVGAGVDEDSGAPWIAMELLEGQDLYRIVTRNGPLSSAEVASVFEQLGHALEAAHAAGVVHRDLKPENLFLATSRRVGATQTLKVLDFGIAKHAVDLERGATVTSAIGSPLWMAPEQTQPGAQVTPATDVWALGLIAFHLLTGRYYWRAANAVSFGIGPILAELMLDSLPPASERAKELGAGVPSGFDPWFGRCVAREPKQRFREAGEAARELVALLEGARDGHAALADTSPASATPGQAPAPVARQRTTPLSDTPANAVEPKATAPLTGPVPGATPQPSSSRGPLVVMVALALVLGAGASAGAWFAFDAIEGAATARQAANVEPAPSNGDRTAEPEDEAAPSSQPVAVPLGVPAPEAIAPEAIAPEAIAPEAIAPSRTPARPAREEAGFLDLVTRPPSLVSIDGQPVGPSPLRRHALSPGRHRIVCTAAYGPERAEADIDIIARAVVSRLLVLGAPAPSLPLAPTPAPGTSTPAPGTSTPEPYARAAPPGQETAAPSPPAATAPPQPETAPQPATAPQTATAPQPATAQTATAQTATAQTATEELPRALWSSDIDRVCARVDDPVRACLGDERTVRVYFTIAGGTGRITQLRTDREGPIGDCAMRHVRTLQFPRFTQPEQQTYHTYWAW